MVRCGNQYPRSDLNARQWRNANLLVTSAIIAEARNARETINPRASRGVLKNAARISLSRSKWKHLVQRLNSVEGMKSVMFTRINYVVKIEKRFAASWVYSTLLKSCFGFRLSFRSYKFYKCRINCHARASCE